MNMKQWTYALAALGLVTIPAGLQAEEKMNPVLTALSPTTLSGYVNTSVHYNPGTGNASVPSYAFNAGKQDGFNLDVVSLSIEKALAAREYDRIPSLMSDRWLSDCTLFGPAREVRAGIEAWQASGLKTLILVPSSTGGGQFEAVREVFALYE